MPWYAPPAKYVWPKQITGAKWDVSLLKTESYVKITLSQPFTVWKVSE